MYLLVMLFTMATFVTLLMAPLAALHAADAPADPTPARPPVWAAKGAYVFRVSTPDEANVLPQLEQGHEIVANLLDGTVPQITIVNGLIGHDHPGAWNWDGLWPYFFSWGGTGRPWKLPADWNDVPRATLYPLTPEGRGKGLPIAINDRTITPSLLPQVPYILVPETK